MKEILNTMLSALTRGEGVMLCSILKADGSSPRGAGAHMAISGLGSTRSAIERSADPQPASSKSFPPRTGAAERRTSMAASGLLRIRPPVLEAAEPGEKDGVG